MGKGQGLRARARALHELAKGRVAAVQVSWERLLLGGGKGGLGRGGAAALAPYFQ